MTDPAFVSDLHWINSVLSFSTGVEGFLTSPKVCPLLIMVVGKEQTF